MEKTRWYVLHAYSGYEKKVADSIIEQAGKLGISDQIEEVSVPTQNITEVKRGVRVNLERKIFPGYILIKMHLNEDTWHIIKTPPKLTGCKITTGVIAPGLPTCKIISFTLVTARSAGNL